MVYMVTFTINIPPMLVYIPYMDPMGSWFNGSNSERLRFEAVVRRHHRHGPTDGQAAQATQALPQLGGWNARPWSDAVEVFEVFTGVG